MAASVVANPTPTVGTDASVEGPTFSSAPSADNVVIHVVIHRASGGGVSVTADDAGGSQLVDYDPGGVVLHANYFVHQGTGSKTQWTFTLGSSVNAWLCFAFDVSGLDDATLSAIEAATEGTTAWTSGTTGTPTTGTPSQADLFMIGVGVEREQNVTGAWTTGTGEQQATNTGGPTARISATVATFSRNTDTSTVSDTYTGGASSGTPMLAVLAAFKVAAAGSGGTASPAATSLSFVVPASTVTGGGTVTPSPIAPTLSTPAASATGGASVAGTPIAPILALPSATVAAGGTVTPTTVVPVLTLPTPTVTGGGMAQPPVITPTLALPVATAAESSTAVPSPIATTMTVPTASVTGGASIALSPIVPTFTIPAAVVTGGSVVESAPISLTFVAPSATVTGGGAATPAVIAVAIAVAGADVTGGGLATPSSIAVTLALPAINAFESGDSTISPDAIALSVGLPTPWVIAEISGVDTGPYLYYVYRRLGNVLYLCPSGQRIRRNTWSTLEGWEDVSERIRISAAVDSDLVDATVRAAWAENSGEAAATLQSAIHGNLTAAGVKKYDGTTLS